MYSVFSTTNNLFKKMASTTSHTLPPHSPPLPLCGTVHPPYGWVGCKSNELSVILPPSTGGTAVRCGDARCRALDEMMRNGRTSGGGTPKKHSLTAGSASDLHERATAMRVWLICSAAAPLVQAEGKDVMPLKDAPQPEEGRIGFVCKEGRETLSEGHFI